MAHGILLFLAKVKCFPRMNLEPNTLNKVLVRDLPITILVEVIEDNIALRFGQWESPMLQEEDQLTLVNVRVVVLVKILEGLSDSIPLLPDLLYQLVQNNAIGHDSLRSQLFVVSFAFLLVLLVHFKIDITL